MGSIFAMTGLAEAAMLNGLLLVAAVLALVAGLLGLAWRKQWWLAAAVGWVLCLIAGLLLQPWSAFRGPEFPNDPDEIYWLIRWRLASGVWAAVFAAAVYSLIAVIRRRRLQRYAPETD